MNRTASILVGAAVFGSVAAFCAWLLTAGDRDEATAPPAPAVAAPALRDVVAGETARADTARVHGIVLRPDGSPAVKAHVRLLRQESAWPEWRTQPIAGEVVDTGADGTFRFRTERAPLLLVEFEHQQFAGDLMAVPPLLERLELRLRGSNQVEGRVLGANGQPLPGARVALESTVADARRVDTRTTGIDGSYTFADVAAGAVRIVARHDAWQPVIIPWVMVGDGRPHELRFEQPALTLSGTVAEIATETPVAGAEVFAITAGQQIGRSAATVVRTDAAGAFQLAGLARGNLRLEIRHPKYSIATRTVVVGPQSQNQLFELSPRIAVSGRLVASAGTATAGARLTLRSAADELVDTAVGADGSFQFDAKVTPGWATLAVPGCQFAFAGSSSAVLQVFIEEGSDGRLDLDAVAPTVLAGRVVDEAGMPVAAARLSVVQTDLVRERLLQAGTALWERNLGKLGDQLTRSASGEPELLLGVTDEAGMFRIVGMPPGPLSIRVQHVGHGTRQVAREVPVAGSGAAADIVLSPACRIGGHVLRGGQPLPGAQVDVKADGVTVLAIADLYGHYELPDLPPGSYRVRARFATLSASKQSPDVTPSRPAEVDLEFQPARFVGGTVVDSNRQPVEGAVVQVTGEGGNRATTDAEGRFQLEVEASNRALELQVGYGGRPALALVAVAPDVDRVPIQIETPQLCTVSGEVYGLPGHRKLSGVLVRYSREGGEASSQWVELQAGVLRQPLLPEGRWRLLLWCEGYAPHVENDVLARPGEEVQLREILLEPGCKLRGRVVDGSGRPVGGAELLLGDEADLGRFQLQARSEPDGNFVAAGVSSDAATLVVRARGYAIRSVPLRLPQDVLGTVPLTVQLDAGARIVVRTTAAGDGVVVLLRGRRIVDTKVVDDAGVAEFEHVAPGEYVVQMASSGDDLQQRVQITRTGETQEVDLQ